MEDRRAHERIDGLEKSMSDHLGDHLRFETALADNTALTRTIAENTSELVILVKGAKWGRRFIVWATPIVAAFMALWAWVSGSPK
jgi:hypothetical protein